MRNDFGTLFHNFINYKNIINQLHMILLKVKRIPVLKQYINNYKYIKIL